jgi:ATP-dependent Lhr-like helicase
MSEPNASAVLDLFLPVVAEWFRRTFGEPSPVQVQGWPVIASGQHTLLVAPTGSGKTLAAFLLGLDRLWRTASETDTVRVLYVSPLRALSYDISRNLELPLREVPRVAAELGVSLPRLRLAVRTGDTSSRDRGRLLRQPPHILITTPESLHLLLTSQGRQILRRVEWCIVDEWHALCPNKRGVFLTLLLERLAWWAGRDFQRIGLSATLRPVEAAASMLAGTGRSMTIVDLGQSRPLDVAVLAPAADSALLQETSVWPAIESATLRLIEQHTSTLVFTNNRRAAERMSARLRESWEIGAGDAEDPHAIPVRSHHGSLSLEVRRQTEQQLKAGQLRAVVATASLELGLDIGSVDLVCQIESPGSIWRAWQRLGRSGHRVGAVCKGRFLAKTVSDLVELAALVRAMRQGILEETTTPPNCLDVLAQQIVAMVAMDAWPVAELRQVIRRAWPYRQLPDTALENVLRMLSARWPGLDSALWRPRLAWDRASDTLYPLPGSQHLALVNGGTIPDTGQYKVILADTGVVLGTLDEEFVYERRLGDAFVLGTGVWRIEDIGAQEVVVRRTSPHEPAVMPFWRGERLGRSWELGLAVGRLLRELRNRLHDRDCLDWLGRECGLEPHAARQLWDYVHRQLEQTGVVPCEDTILVEAFPDEMGDWYLAVLSPFGQRWHFTLRLALESWWKERYGCAAPAVHHDDGVLIRLLDTGEPPVDVLQELLPERVEKDVLASLGSCAFFAIRFRQNAMRSLLLPRLHPQRRTPLWLQRLKARNLLQLVERCPDFPVVMETYRECLNEHLDVPRLRQVLEKIRNGEIAVRRIVHDFPSPFAAQLRFQFTGAFMYDYDRVEPAQRSPAINVEPLRQLLAPATPESIDETALVNGTANSGFPHSLRTRTGGMASPSRRYPARRNSRGTTAPPATLNRTKASGLVADSVPVLATATLDRCGRFAALPDSFRGGKRSRPGGR